MEKIDEWVKTCLRKKRMREEHADEVIERAAKEGTTLRKYLCPHCFAWHVTKKPLDVVINEK